MFGVDGGGKATGPFEREIPNGKVCGRGTKYCRVAVEHLQVLVQFFRNSTVCSGAFPSQVFIFRTKTECCSRILCVVLAQLSPRKTMTAITRKLVFLRPTGNVCDWLCKPIWFAELVPSWC
ncbi:unnamed protein product [Ectocarpus sp. 13 AM-2016]